MTSVRMDRSRLMKMRSTTLLAWVLAVVLATPGSTSTWAAAGEGGSSACGGPCRCISDPSAPGCPGGVTAAADPPYYFVNHLSYPVHVTVGNAREKSTCWIKPNEACQPWLHSNVAQVQVGGYWMRWTVQAERVYEIGAGGKLWRLSGSDADQIKQLWR